MGRDSFEEPQHILWQHCLCDRCLQNNGDWKASGHRIMHVHRPEPGAGWWTFCRECRLWCSGPDGVTYRHPDQSSALAAADRHLGESHNATSSNERFENPVGLNDFSATMREFDADLSTAC